MSTIVPGPEELMLINDTQSLSFQSSQSNGGSRQITRQSQRIGINDTTGEKIAAQFKQRNPRAVNSGQESQVKFQRGGDLSVGF